LQRACLFLNLVQAAAVHQVGNLVHPVPAAVNLVPAAAAVSPVRQARWDLPTLQAAWEAVLEAENIEEDTRAAVARAEAALEAQHQAAHPVKFSS
jgi:hypothetical protein